MRAPAWPGASVSATPCLVASLPALAWLATSRHPRLLHCFNQAVNLANEAGQVLSLVTQAGQLGPCSLHVALPAFPPTLHPATAIIIDGLSDPPGLRLGPLAIELRQARRWSPRLPAGVLAGESVKPHLPALKQQIQDVVPQSLFASAEPPAPYARVLPPLLEQLGGGLAVEDEAACRAVAARLAGLGPGLTPAGDDFLLGVLLALWLAKGTTRLALAIVEEAAPRTTTLSAASLRAAGQGDAGILWHRLLQALRAPEEGNVTAAAAGILAAGHTSGADALSGFIWAWQPAPPGARRKKA